MALVLDIGNTAVTYGIYGGGRLLRHGSALCSDIPKLAKIWSKSGVKKYARSILISSVVPRNTAFLRSSLRKILGAKVKVLGKDIKVPIKHKYKQIRNLGADRAVNIYGAVRIHRPPMLIVDYGTAITFDFVSAKGVFEGGMIVPGPELSFQALIDRAALLPKKARLPLKDGTFLGKTTYDCMKAGILQGYGALTDGLVDRFKARYGKMTVLATGGFTTHLKPYTRSIDIFDPLHSIKSLVLIHKALVR